MSLQQLRKHQSALYDNAVIYAADVNRKAIEVSLDIAKEKTQFFEKLAIGCGAAVLAMASYIGSKPGIHLHPYWLPRAALVSLALGTCVALIRNWRFQAYTMAHWLRENVSAQRQRLEAEDVCMRESGGPDHNGPIAPEEWRQTFETERESYTVQLASQSKRERSIHGQLFWLEHLMLLCVMSAVGFVVALCWINF